MDPICPQHMLAVPMLDQSKFTRYNINLVGDVEAVRAYDDVTGELATKIPLTVPEDLAHQLRGALPRKSQIEPDLLKRTTRTSTLVRPPLMPRSDERSATRRRESSRRPSWRPSAAWTQCSTS